MRISDKKKLLKKYTLVVPLILFFLVLVYLQKDNNISGDEIIRRVGEIYVLPKDEVPTILNVSDIDLVKDRPFFEKAKVGFKVLVYASSSKALLYDAIKNVVVEVGPVNSVLKY